MNEEKIYARALAIMTSPGRRLVVTAWSVSTILGLIIIACFCTVLALAFDRSVPVKTLAVSTEDMEGRLPGTEGRLHIFVNRKRSCPAYARRVFVDSGHERYFDPKDGPRPFPPPRPEDMGEQDFYTAVDIPATMDPGETCGYVDLQYFCNPLQRFLNWPVSDSSPKFCWRVGAKP